MFRSRFGEEYKIPAERNEPVKAKIAELNQKLATVDDGAYEQAL